MIFHLKIFICIVVLSFKYPKWINLFGLEIVVKVFIGIIMGKRSGKYCYICSSELELGKTLLEHQLEQHQEEISRARVSSSMGDAVRSACKVCGDKVKVTDMRNHTKKTHGMTITEYKERYNQHHYDLVELVLHRCGLCGEHLLLDSDYIARHLKIARHNITHENYNAQYMTLMGKSSKPAKQKADEDNCDEDNCNDDMLTTKSKKRKPMKSAAKLTTTDITIPKMIHSKMIQLDKIRGDVNVLEKKILKFTGLKTDKEYLYLEEMLTKNLLSLDGIDPDGDQTIKQKRKETVNIVQRCLSFLEQKANENASKNASNNSTMIPMETNADAVRDTAETVPVFSDSEVTVESFRQFLDKISDDGEVLRFAGLEQLLQLSL